MTQLHLGDCLQILKTIEANTVHAVVCDPPYGLSFMGKGWDYDVPAIDIWRECLRVLKPGGHLLAFAGTRTQHRMAVNIEDAGFEIRDMIAWVYGSGFPKSLDVSKAIDKRGGNVAEFAGFRDAVKAAMRRNGVTRQRLQDALGNFMVSHYLTSGSQPAVPVLRDYRIIRDTVGLGHEFDGLFNDEAEREVVGEKSSGLSAGSGNTVGRFTDSRNGRGMVNITAPATEAAQQWHGWGTALKPALEPITVARKPLDGTVAANVLQHGVGGINVDGCRVGTEGGARYDVGSQQTQSQAGAIPAYASSPKVSGLGRWPANLIHDGLSDVLGAFSGTSTGSTAPELELGQTGTADTFGENSPARFFYCAKASKRDRDEGCEWLQKKRTAKLAGADNDRTDLDPVSERFRTSPSRNHHPTVKPTHLMRYLCRLVTPPGGIVLDPFMGSGSTGKAALLEGFRFVGIDRDQDYFTIAQARIAAVEAK